jgi:4-aminobutyrate aminotransferase
MQARFAAIRDVRAVGAYFGLELADSESAPEAPLAERLLYQALADGLSFKIGAGNVVTLCPPLTISDTDFDHALSILDSSLSRVC